jgi:hypothetical protein
LLTTGRGAAMLEQVPFANARHPLKVNGKL